MFLIVNEESGDSRWCSIVDGMRTYTADALAEWLRAVGFVDVRSEDKTLVKRCKDLVKEGKSGSAYHYKYDLSGNFKRSLYIFLFGLNQRKKFNKYCTKY